MMQPAQDIRFGKFRLDTANECLWQGERPIALRPKAFAVLKLLVERAGLLVTKQEVLDAVWAGTFVGDAVLKDCIRQLRDALADDAAAPAFIETAHRRGYRFIAKLSSDSAPDSAEANRWRSEKATLQSAAPGNEQAVRVLGRDSELERMRRWLQSALGGERQVVFITGEAGIGKTTLVQALLDEAAQVEGIRIARGQCLEHYGAGEAYMPVLDGFSRLGRTEAGKQIVDVFSRSAPSWLGQIPSLIGPTGREGFQGHAPGATRERMLREMADALEALTREFPLILVLEDLHWSDYSTIDLISYLARRRDPARLMVIGTYRPVEVILGEHPIKSVKRELQAHGLCNELALEYLSEKAVGAYLAIRFPGLQFHSRLARMIHQRTEGNPLFMVNVVKYLVDEKLIMQEGGRWKLQADIAQVETGVPENLKQLIERQIERLSPDERMVLEGASAVGMECSSAAIAAGLDRPTEWVEKHCEELARRHQFLSPAWLVELPDGTITPRHRFIHILYLEVPYRLVPAMRRSQVHRRIAAKGVEIYGERASEIAAELAMHFEQSRDWSRALTFLLQAAENAGRRSAHHEASSLAKRGLEVIRFLPDSEERAKQEIKLRMTLGISQMAIKGFASAEVEEIYVRGKELFWLQGPSPELFHMLWSLNLYYQFSGEVRSSLELSNQLLELAEGLKNGPLIMESHRALGAVLVVQGQYKEALHHLEQASAMYVKHRDHAYVVFTGLDCKVVCEAFAARALWALGYPDRAAQRTAAAFELARELGHPQSLIVIGHFAAQLHQLRGEVSLVYQRAQEARELADEYGLELWLSYAEIELGWAEAELGNAQQGIERMQRGIAAYQATRAKLWSSYSLGLLADQLAKAGRVEEALAAVAQALEYSEHSGERHSLAELLRMKGELILQAAKGKAASEEEAVQAARACFAESLRIAREQGAKAWELRTAVSIGQLERGRGEFWDRDLADAFAWFTEGHETADLKKAQEMLKTVLA